MRAQVYARQSNHEAAHEFAEHLRDRGWTVLEGNSRYYEGEVHHEMDHVWHDGAVPEIQENHAAAGVPCERFSLDDDTADPADADVDEPEPDAEPAQSMGPPEGYEIVENGSWHTVHGPDGEKVGKSQRDYGDAVMVAWADAEGDN